MTKKYMAGTHAQAAIEGLLELIEEHDIDPEGIRNIHIEGYESAVHVMGGGEGDRHAPKNREQADHSIPYTLAATALDGELMKDQYRLERIRSNDVRRLIQTITVEENPEMTKLFNEEGKQAYIITITDADGDEYRNEKTAFEGHPSNRMSWEQAEKKFHGIAAETYDEPRRKEIIGTIRTLEDHSAQDLATLL